MRLKPFKVLDIPAAAIKGSNLIEASAGTGKTYSIGLLVLRIIIEKDIAVNEMLIVTFTNAAVAELQDRVHRFLIAAMDYVNGEEIDNPDIIQLIDSAPVDKDGIRRRIKASLLLLDEAAIVTIHSFCQIVLNRYAFDTQQVFGAVLQTDNSEIIESELNKFWRREITTLPVSLLDIIGLENTKSDLLDLLSRHLSGKVYWGYDPDYTYVFDADEQLRAMQQVRDAEEVGRQRVYVSFQKYRHGIDTILEKNKRSSLYKLTGDPGAFLDEFIVLLEGRNPQYLAAFPAAYLTAIDEWKKGVRELDLARINLMHQLKCYAIRQVVPRVKERLSRNNVLTYDDLINNLHRVVMKQGGNEHLLEKVRHDFRAVFIDEFQDTDRLQFDIFKKLFADHADTITFMIGDPKQNIYGFRGADVDAYLTAKSVVDTAYGMNRNYRSTRRMVAAANRFFLPDAGFDTFFYQGQSEGIQYHEVESNDHEGALLRHGRPEPSLDLLGYKNADGVNEFVVDQVSALLSPGSGYEICDQEGITRPVRPSDIGILVRKGKDGQKLKGMLNTFNIPAIVMNDTNILQTDTAREVAYLLDAVLRVSQSSVRRALFTRLLDMDVPSMLHADPEALITRFRAYRTLWLEESVYELLSRIQHDFNIEPRLNTQPGGARILANYIQIVQLLHRRQVQKGLSQEELLVWLYKSIQGLENEGDEYIQEIEGDQEAVRIVTIHKSKGLEYNIVFAYNLSFDRKVNDKWAYVDFKDKEGNNYFVETGMMEDKVKANFEIQAEQENRRLMYVAVTRAVYKCYLPYSTFNFSPEKSSLAPFVEELQSIALKDSEYRLDAVPLPERMDLYHTTAGSRPQPIALDPQSVSLPGRYWRRMSYSALSAKGEPFYLQQTSILPEGYDDFIFTQLTPGSHTGNLLHYLFEHISFSGSRFRKYALQKSLLQFGKNKDKGFAARLEQVVDHVLGATICLGDQEFSLSEVEDERTLRELEFTFPVLPAKVKDLLQIASETLPFLLSSDTEAVLEGLMTGFIDLFFEKNGKYYILDWKSNYLGNTLAAYQEPFLTEAMTASNYHLQYLIYTYAVCKFLKSRNPGFDYDRDFGGVVYVFLRGARAGSKSGIFVDKIDEEVLDRMQKLLG